MKIGSLCSGYGGLELGVQAVYGGETAWVSDIDKGACKILAHRFPGVPNIGDMTTVDWATVEPVDLICGGTPCQDLSHAGKRAGMTEGSRSNLWVAMREAIAVIRPKFVVWENVRGAYSAEADSQPASRITVTRRKRGQRAHRSVVVGGGLLALPDGGPSLRALGRVLGDLSDLGYDASWHGLRAADIGAPHGRFRVFVTATDARDGAGHGERPCAESGQGGAAASIAEHLGHERTRSARDGRTGPADGDSGALMGTPTARMWKGSGPVGSASHQWLLDHGNVEAQVLSLLPTPAVNDMGAGKTVEAWDDWTDAMQARHGNGNGHGKSLAIEAQRLLPTPNAGDSGTGRLHSGGNPTLKGVTEGTRPSDTARHGTTYPPMDRWGDYAAAIARWEHVLGRPAPAPTMTSTKGNPQLSPAFVEWLMGLPAGWVTDVPGITRNEALKGLGNGVVPQQAAEALRVMASWEVAV